MNTNTAITEVNLPNMQSSNIPHEIATKTAINQSSTSDYTEYKNLNQYKLSEIKDLHILPTASLVKKTEHLLNSCLQTKITELEKDIAERPHYSFRRGRDRVISGRLEDLNSIRLEKLMQLSEENKHILCKFIEKLYNYLNDSMKDLSKKSVAWSVHDLYKDDLIKDDNFIDNLIISLVNSHLEELSTPEEEQQINRINSFLTSNTDIYYMSAKYISDKSIQIIEISIRKLSTYKYPDRMSKYRFHFNIQKQEDSKDIKTLKNIKKNLHRYIFKEQVDNWINYHIKNLIESINFTQSTSATDAKLAKLKNLSVTDKNKLCDFIAYFYQSLVTHKNKLAVDSKKIPQSKILWNVDSSITSTYIDKLVVASIKYFINLLSNPQPEYEKCINQIDSFMDNANFLYQIYIEYIDDKNNFKIANAVSQKKGKFVKSGKNSYQLISLIPGEEDTRKYTFIEFEIKAIKKS
jgi:hypothetical protein